MSEDKGSTSSPPQPSASEPITSPTPDEAKLLQDAERFHPDAATGASATPAASPEVSHKFAWRIDTGWATSMQSLMVTVVIALFIITFLAQAFTIPSESMQNTLLIGDYLLVDKVDYGDQGRWPYLLPYAGIRRGDIIVFKYPVNPAQHFVKRVIAIAGDHVRLANKRAWVNGKAVNERSYAIFRHNDFDEYRDNFPLYQSIPDHVDANWWLQMPRYLQNGEIVVPPDSYFALGDNRDSSLDSRYWGFVPRQNIIGRPLLIYFSLRAWPADEAASGAGDKLASLVFGISHLWERVRWSRMLRPIR